MSTPQDVKCSCPRFSGTRIVALWLLPIGWHTLPTMETTRRVTSLTPLLRLGLDTPQPICVPWKEILPASPCSDRLIRLFCLVFDQPTCELNLQCSDAIGCVYKRELRAGFPTDGEPRPLSGVGKVPRGPPQCALKRFACSLCFCLFSLRIRFHFAIGIFPFTWFRLLLLLKDGTFPP